jgi:hypothetical protein
MPPPLPKQPKVRLCKQNLAGTGESDFSVEKSPAVKLRERGLNSLFLTGEHSDIRPDPLEVLFLKNRCN